MDSLNIVAQSVIVLCGVTGIFLSQCAEYKRRRVACLFGLAAQPAWFYSSISSGQWGIVVVCFFYTGAWLHGFYTYWIKPCRTPLTGR